MSDFAIVTKSRSPRSDKRANCSSDRQAACTTTSTSLLRTYDLTEIQATGATATNECPVSLDVRKQITIAEEQAVDTMRSRTEVDKLDIFAMVGNRCVVISPSLQSEKHLRTRLFSPVALRIGSFRSYKYPITAIKYLVSILLFHDE